MFRTTLIAIVLLLLAASATPRSLNAQEPGDFFWRFAPHGAFADDRVELAVVLLVDTDAVLASAGLDATLYYADGRLEENRAELVASGLAAEESTLLFEAAGVGDPAEGLAVTRPCRFWAPQSDPTGIDADRIAVGEALGAEISNVLTQLGLEVAPCELVPTSDEADFYVWSFAQDLHLGAEQPDSDADSFLAFVVDRPGAIPGGTGGIPNVTPPTTGDGGLR